MCLVELRQLVVLPELVDCFELALAEQALERDRIAVDEFGIVESGDRDARCGHSSRLRRRCRRLLLWLLSRRPRNGQRRSKKRKGNDKVNLGSDSMR